MLCCDCQFCHQRWLDWEEMEDLNHHDCYQGGSCRWCHLDLSPTGKTEKMNQTLPTTVDCWPQAQELLQMWVGGGRHDLAYSVGITKLCNEWYGYCMIALSRRLLASSEGISNRTLLWQPWMFLRSFGIQPLGVASMPIKIQAILEKLQQKQHHSKTVKAETASLQDSGWKGWEQCYRWLLFQERKIQT